MKTSMLGRMVPGNLSCGLLSLCGLKFIYCFRSYFFSVECLNQLAMEAGFDVFTCHYVNRRTINKKEGVDEPRVFIQGKFIKK